MQVSDLEDKITKHQDDQKESQVRNNTLGGSHQNP